MPEVWIGRLGRILPAELLRPPPSVEDVDDVEGKPPISLFQIA